VRYCPINKSKCYEGKVEVGYDYQANETEFKECIFWGVRYKQHFDPDKGMHMKRECEQCMIVLAIEQLSSR